MNEKARITEKNTRIKLARVQLLDFLEKNKQHLKSMDDVYISDHLAQRIVERKLEKDIPFVIAIVVGFMTREFYKTTYSQRRYIVQYKGLQVGLMITTGGESERRYCVVNTAFTANDTYECDETIDLS